MGQLRGLVLLKAVRSRPDVVRRPTPPGAIQRSPHQMGKCPRVWLQLGDVNINKL